MSIFKSKIVKIDIFEGDDDSWAGAFAVSPNLSKISEELYYGGGAIDYDLFLYFGEDPLPWDLQQLDINSPLRIFIEDRIWDAWEAFDEL